MARNLWTFVQSSSTNLSSYAKGSYIKFRGCWRNSKPLKIVVSSHNLKTLKMKTYLYFLQWSNKHKKMNTCQEHPNTSSIIQCQFRESLVNWNWSKRKRKVRAQGALSLVMMPERRPKMMTGIKMFSKGEDKGHIQLNQNKWGMMSLRFNQILQALVRGQVVLQE
jgi:hypothetical protein